MDAGFSDYIIYVDESGDHSLESIDPNYPVFVLAFCIFNKRDYAHTVSSAIKKFKFNYFGHDMVLLHEHDIRKAKKEFVILVNEETRHTFMDDLNELINDAPFTVISMVIEKKSLKNKYADPANPYHLALGFGLERIYTFLKEKQQGQLRTHIIFECRGKKEDNDLELEFRRVCDGSNYWGVRLPFDMILADKKTNSCGLQLADLIARPIGRYTLDPKQENRAYHLIEKKFYRNGNGKKEGWGLKRFP
ncbi:hypothetical protein Lste_0139 [Legionella steelei]|uniref:3-deoxy-D-manno-octulosonic-acid transferase n=2 Tax=Legionella TaxID=445 RepID=A0A0W0ZSC5_9GAMM|nr:DUF3800 domain-containing protein [Legionella steelei]KTD71854.1 hypothetical protein Lste_0139 [Legionella steelei]MBN9229607.1 DUF3800 domain-containing protein [Legionella sp.]